MLTNEVVYANFKKKQVAEIPGPKDHPWIKMAHKLCFIPTQYDLDATVPWCRSGMVLEIVGVGLQRNPGRICRYLKDKGHSTQFIEEICKEYGVIFTLTDNNVDVLLPKLSAAAYDSIYDGYSVAPERARRGDWLVFVRRNKLGKIIGHHITCLDEDKLGKIFVRCTGCNQNNMISSSNSYLRVNLLRVVRAVV